MPNGFLVIPSGIEVDPTGDKEVSMLTRLIISRTITVFVGASVGEAAIVAGKIVTSLFLVGDHMKVSVRIARRKPMAAFVARRDQSNKLAELRLAIIGPDPTATMASGEFRINKGDLGGIEAAALVPDAASGRPVVTAAGISYKIHASDLKENAVWDILPQLPDGMAGGGPGQPGRQTLFRFDGSTEVLASLTHFEAAVGDILRMETPGGGGWGAVPGTVPLGDCR